MEIDFKLEDLEFAMRYVVSFPLKALVFTIFGSCTLHIPFSSYAAYASFTYVWAGMQITVQLQPCVEQNTFIALALMAA